MSDLIAKIRPYTAFRFFVQLENGESLGLSVISSEPFGGGLWLGRGHMSNEPTLMERLRGQKTLRIWMVQRQADRDSTCRKIEVTWSSMRWLPFDLNATDSSVAMEWLVLEDADYTTPVDVPWSEVGPSITRSFDPRFKELG